MGELEFVSWLQDLFHNDSEDIIAGVGDDDCAIVKASEDLTLAVTTDMLIEGTHFLADDDPFKVGWKSVAVNLSDLAASGCKPLWGVVAAGVRQSADKKWARELARGIADCASEYGLAIVGGDTTSGTGPGSITITVIGKPFGNRAILRGGARPGDVLAVTGTLGGSILGRHLKPEPRLAEAQQLVEMAEIHACMDISDGLSLDLYRMMRASGCGAEVTRGSIPVSDAAIELAKTSGRSPLTHALEDGEDFELLFSVSPVDYDIISNQWPGNMLARITAIGTVNNSGKIVMVNEDGSGEELTPTGYTHNW